MESVKKEIDDLGHTGPYRPPARLRKRSEFSSKGAVDDNKVFEANEYVSALCFALILRGACFSSSEIASTSHIASHSLSNIQCIQTPSLFSHFVTLRPYTKIV